MWESKQLLDKKMGVSLGAEKTAEIWRNEVNISPESFTTGFVDAVFTVMKRLFHIEEIQRVLIEADSAGTTPFDSVYKYEALVKRAPTVDMIAWCATGAIDFTKAGFAICLYIHIVCTMV